VILINLLPHREAARRRRRDAYNAALVASALVGGVVAVGLFLWLQASIFSQDATNVILKTEITKLEAQIKDIAGLETEIASLKARQQAVEDLQSDRNAPLHLLTELVQQLPEGVYITKMVQADQAVTLNGVAQTNERVSELLRNLSNNTPWFAKPELVEIVAGTIGAAREQKRVSNFVMRVRLVRSIEAEKSAANPEAASSPPKKP
jgi:type IV pilus assembly protein PilN